MRMISVVETAKKVEYIRKKCKELLCTGTSSRGGSQWKGMEYSGRCRKTGAFQ